MVFSGESERGGVPDAELWRRWRLLRKTMTRVLMRRPNAARKRVRLKYAMMGGELLGCGFPLGKDRGREDGGSEASSTRQSGDRLTPSWRGGSKERLPRISKGSNWISGESAALTRPLVAHGSSSDRQIIG